MYTLKDKDYLQSLKNTDPEVYKYIVHLQDEKATDIKKGCHDVANIISLINGNLQLIKLHNPSLLDSTRFKQIEDDMNYLINTISSISTFRYSNSVNLKVVDCENYFWSLYDMIPAMTNINQMQIAITVPPNLPAAMMDTDKINYVVKSLLTNIIEEDENASITLVIDYNEHYIKLHIIDELKKFDQEVKANLFKPFVTSKQEHIGLSLATSYQIMMAHNGMLEYSDNTPCGSIFTLSIPIIFR